jgi:hypothetical protein
MQTFITTIIQSLFILLFNSCTHAPIVETKTLAVSQKDTVVLPILYADTVVVPYDVQDRVVAPIYSDKTFKKETTNP